MSSTLRTLATVIALGATLASLSAAQTRSRPPCVPPPPGAKLWSSPATWGGNLPARGDAVVIPIGETVVLDVSPPALASLAIEGTLLFGCRPLSLEVDRIDVVGELSIGTGNAHYHRAVIELDDEFHSPLDPLAKSLIVHPGGRLEMRGEPRSHSWLRLARTAHPGDSTLALEEPVDWRPGERIVLASTDFDFSQAEEHFIESVSADRTTLTLTSTLTYLHWGEVEGEGVDERAEVALLDRSLAVRGDPESVFESAGGRITVLGGGSANVQLSWVELEWMGRTGEAGYHPLHFDTVGDATGSAVQHCAIHHSYNRSIALHGCTGLDIEGNVAYDTLGHAFLADPTSIGNRFAGNLGLFTCRPAPGLRLLKSDIEPTTYYLMNTANELVGNAAAGSEGHGFWFHIEKEDWESIAPGVFHANTAHSNEIHGFYANDRVFPTGAQTYTDFTTYKNREFGVWYRTLGQATWNHVAAADNRAGFYMATGGFQKRGSYVALRNSVVIGESKNVGTPGTHYEAYYGRSLPDPEYPYRPLIGFEIYDGLVGVYDTHFANFRPAWIQSVFREGAAFGPAFYESPWAIDARNHARGVTLKHSKAAYFKPPEDKAIGIASTVLYDQDGSLTGAPDQYIVAATELLTPTLGSTFVADWNAHVVPGPGTAPHHYAYAQLAIHDRAYLGFPHLRIDSLTRSAGRDVYDPHQSGENQKQGGETHRYPAGLLLDDTYAVTFPTGPTRDIDFELRFGPAEGHVLLEIEYALPAPGEVRVNSTTVAAARDLDALRAGDGNAYYYDDVLETLYLKPVLGGTGPTILDGTETLIEVRELAPGHGGGSGTSGR